MALTGTPLILLAAAGTVAVLAATVLLWSRGGRLRYPLRPLGILLTEALLLVTAGLVANRHEQFYPSWAALAASADPPPTVTRPAAGGWDGWLVARGPGPFAWPDPAWPARRLGRAPQVVPPDGYLTHPSLRYPVIVVLGPPPARPPAARDSVVVYLPATGPEAVDAVATALPHDLRVSGHGWALVAPAASAALAERVLTAAPGRFVAVAEVGRGPACRVAAGIATSRRRFTAREALAWAAGQTPAPLAMTSPPVHRLPAHHAKGRRGAA
ncbi:hypothetical protein [Actinoplanes sp. NPDC049265]|uniref:hypothetical protein n=1 Tax=Actinoplanes sp. NPDC049265 TaxID=3363902 RepID=UPI00371048D5